MEEGSSGACLIAVARLQHFGDGSPRATMEASENEFVARVGTDGRYTYVDPRVVGVLGYLPQDLIGQVSYEYYHPEDIQKMVQLHHDGECCHGDEHHHDNVCDSVSSHNLPMTFLSLDSTVGGGGREGGGEGGRGGGRAGREGGRVGREGGGEGGREGGRGRGREGEGEGETPASMSYLLYLVLCSDEEEDSHAHSPV